MSVEPFDFSEIGPEIDWVNVPPGEPFPCYVCGTKDPLCTPDEGDVWWCPKCISKWEIENQAHWETGQPFKSSDPKI